MPKGHLKYTKHESAALKAHKALSKVKARMDSLMNELAPYVNELTTRPDPVVSPTAKAGSGATKKVRQLKLPGTVSPRKAAKSPAKPRRSRAQRS